jgi:hypothetical protein
MIRHGIAVIAVVAAMGIGAFAQPAGAFHAGEVVDCGSAGTFTIRAMPTRAAIQPEAPGPDNVLFFEEGGTLTVFQLVVNGQVVVDKNATARALNNVDEVTCTLTFELGVFEITGVLTP